MGTRVLCVHWLPKFPHSRLPPFLLILLMDQRELESVLLEQIDQLTERQWPSGITNQDVFTTASPSIPQAFNPPGGGIGPNRVSYRQLAPAPSNGFEHAEVSRMIRNWTDPQPLREQDRMLPMANVARLMTQQLPPSAKIAKDAKVLMQEMVAELICFLTSEAKDVSITEGRRAIASEDIIAALENLDLGLFIPGVEAGGRRLPQPRSGNPMSGLPFMRSDTMSSDDSSVSFVFSASNTRAQFATGAASGTMDSDLDDSFSSVSSGGESFVSSASNTRASSPQFATGAAQMAAQQMPVQQMPVQQVLAQQMPRAQQMPVLARALARPPPPL